MEGCSMDMSVSYLQCYLLIELHGVLHCHLLHFGGAFLTYMGLRRRQGEGTARR